MWFYFVNSLYSTQYRNSGEFWFIQKKQTWQMKVFHIIDTIKKQSQKPQCYHIRLGFNITIWFSVVSVFQWVLRMFNRCQWLTEGFILGSRTPVWTRRIQNLVLEERTVEDHNQAGTSIQTNLPNQTLWTSCQTSLKQRVTAVIKPRRTLTGNHFPALCVVKRSDISGTW